MKRRFSAPTAARRARLSRRVASRTVLAALLALGLGSTPAFAQLGFTHRLTTILYDYDNDGTTDATRSYTYDGAGRITDVSYVYTGDGTPDLFVTEDDDAASETGMIGYTTGDLVDDVSIDRTLMPSGTESFGTMYTFSGGRMTRYDSTATTAGGSSANYAIFSYVGADLDTLTERMTSDDSLVFTQTFAYGGDALPDTVGFDSSGIDASTSFTWRADGQLDDLASSANFMGSPIGSGTADYVYDANGFLQSELWTVSGSVGSFYAEFQGVTYEKTYGYDAQDLRTLEEIDIGNDGSVEATRTLVWQAGACVPAFLFAPNGRPNFAIMPGLPYVPGTGATWLGNCGPYDGTIGAPPPVPSMHGPVAGVLVSSALLTGWLALRRRSARA